MEIPELRGAIRVGLFAPLPDEVAILTLTSHPMMGGRRVCLPRMRPDGSLDFVEFRGDEELTQGRHGVREPREEAPSTALTTDDAVVLPALAFDRRGVRLGRGGGYYDRRFPPGLVRPLLIGVTFSELLVEELPREAHDLAVDIVVTGDDVWRPTPELSR